MNEELNQEIEQEEYVSDSEEVMGQIAVQEELKRIEIQDNPVSKVSKETKSNDFYKESMVTVETVGEAFQKLVGFEVDYNNALAIASALMTNDVTLKQQKMIQIQAEQNQV